MLALGTLSNNRQESPVAGAGIRGRELPEGRASSFTLPSTAPQAVALTSREWAGSTKAPPLQSCLYRHPNATKNVDGGEPSTFSGEGSPEMISGLGLLP